MTDILTRLEWATTGADVKAEAIEEIKRLIHDVERYMAIANEEANRAEAAAARAAAMKERCAQVADKRSDELMTSFEWLGNDYLRKARKDLAIVASNIATAIRNLPDTDGDVNG
jgi:septal ring factor EnvC (AmiA/AmiB activator)